MANASPSDDAINFASGLITITLTKEIVVNNAGALTVYGTGANILTIDGGAGTNQIFLSYGVVTISGVTLTGAEGGGGSIAVGGAIYAENSLTLDGVHITGNSVAGNTLNRAGGGVYFAGGSHRIINSTFSANDGGYCGGGFYNSGGTLAVINSTISGNTAIYGGGFCSFGNTTLHNVTVTKNIAAFGGGIIQDEGTLNLGNTIVASNAATVDSNHEIDAFISEGGNLIGDSPGDSPNGGIIYQPTDIRDTNPMLGALSNNGGATPTHALLPGSPAIDKGLNSLAVDPSNNSILQTDQRGLARIVGSSVDIGAFEFVPAKSNKRIRITF